MNRMKVIVFEEESFYKLIEEVTKKLSKPVEQKWITEEEASKLLGGRSKSTLQKWRNEGRLKFSQPSKKIILFNRDSIMKFLEDNSHKTF